MSKKRPTANKRATNTVVGSSTPQKRQPTLPTGITKLTRSTSGEAMSWAASPIKQVDDAIDAAISLIEAGEHQQAKDSLSHLLDTHPTYPRLWFNHGIASLACKDYVSAARGFGRVLEIDPTHAPSRNNLALVIKDGLGDKDKAMSILRATVADAPTYSDAVKNLCSILISRNEFKEAVEHLEKIKPEHRDSQLWYLLGQATHRLMKWDVAKKCYQNSLIHDPENVMSMVELGGWHYDHQEYAEAEKILLRAIDISPADLDVLDSLSTVYAFQGKRRENIEILEEIIAINPEIRNARFQLAWNLLGAGEFKSGFEQYAYRPSRHKQDYDPIGKPLLQNITSELINSRIQLLADQGIGDEWFFMRFAPQLKSLCKHITYVSNSKILPLIQRLDAVDNVTNKYLAAEDYDHSINIGDLPHLLGIGTAEDVPPSLRIKPLVNEVATINTILRAFGPPPYIGLTWRGGTDPVRDGGTFMRVLRKSIPIEAIAAHVPKSGTIVSLQRLPSTNEINEISNALGRPVLDASMFNDRLEGMLALLDSLDSYYCVSNTNIHLMASLGKTATVFVPQPPEWRWMQEGDSSPWFRGFEIVRQNVNGTWPTPNGAYVSDHSPIESTTPIINQHIKTDNSITGITPDYASLNAQLHASRPDYGTSGKQWADVVRALVGEVKAKHVLDYGCGKQTLAKALPDIEVKGFDPAIPELSAKPTPADVLVCTDVLEHVEPEFIDIVLDELARLTIKVALITVATRPAVKFLADGRNAHLTVQPLSWWKDKFEKRFMIHDIQELEGHEFALIVKSKAHEYSVNAKFSNSTFTQAIEASPPSKGTMTTSLIRGNLKLVFNTPNDMTRWRVTSFDTKEPCTVDWLDNLDPGSVLYDIGANVGMYALYAGARGLNVYAFEPESQNFSILNSNIFSNHLQDKVLAFPLSLSDESKIDKLYMSDFSLGGSCHSFSEEVGFDLMPRKSPFTQGSFSVTLDQLVKTHNLPIPNYIKIDVDGFEHKVLNGAAGILSSPALKSIIVELNTNLPEHMEAVRKLESYGFSHDPEQVGKALRSSGSFKGVGEFIFTRVPKASWNFNTTINVKSPVTPSARHVMHHVLDRVFATETNEAPFPHLVVDNVFPPDYYQQILENFPTQDGVMRSLGDSGRVPKNSYKERHCVLFEQDEFRRMSDKQQYFWMDFATWLYSEEFINCFVHKFHASLQSRIDRIIESEGALHLKGDALLVDDRTSYAIGPHTDAPHRLITFLFYLPETNLDRDLGTSIYTPKKPGFECWGGPHHPHSEFNRHGTVEFLPNRLLAFPKTERSFHGVEPITREGVSRHLLINNIRVMGKVTH